jgi:hypothetical protein
MAIGPVLRRNSNLERAIDMRLLSWVLGASVLLGTGLLVGCGESGGTPMKNMKPGTGADEKKEIKTRKGVKPLPSEPPEPQPPPPPGSKSQKD